MFEKRAAPGADGFEVGGVGEQFVAGGNIDSVAVERDAAQAAVGAAALPVDVGGVPVDRLVDRLPFEVDQIYAAVALALLASANDRACDKLDYMPPNPFRKVNQIVRGRCCARILR